MGDGTIVPVEQTPGDATNLTSVKDFDIRPPAADSWFWGIDRQKAERESAGFPFSIVSC
jgi:hypothetical protein